ncbi:trypsin alpha-like [Bradysia coprophila]|uniref:trypsin alpha-like n=1 Tax=Bradysia coprophila TaxID=38358 RepID=UPI00187DD10E|nr:trypsin alpha-like [Bradysia coprophila]
MKSISLALLFVTLLICSSVEANSLGRIVNGDQAVFYQFPWHCSIQNTKTTAAKAYCGGTLIAANYVLTAASCLKDVSLIQVDYGSILFSQPFETQYTTQYQNHPQYNEQYKINNIAIIRLPASVTFRTNVRAILLPRVSDQGDTYESYDSYVSGFGVAEAGSSYLSNELRYAQKTVISNDVCRQSFDYRYIESTVLCATGFNGSTQSICYGDQGGALISHIDGAWVQIAVASNIHPNGCTGLAPAAYTRVGPYLEWIERLTGIALRP